MKNIGKAIGAGVAIIVLGVIIFVVALGLNDWKIADEGNYEMKSYECVGEISAINLDFAVGKIKTEFYDGEHVKIDYAENSRLTTTCEENAGTLTVKTDLLRKWFNFRWILDKTPETVIYIPKDSVISLGMEVNAGTVNIADGNYQNVKVNLNAGTVKFGATVCNYIECDVNAGTLNVGSISCSRVKCDISAGTINLSNVTCDDINVEVSAGTANVSVDGNKADYNIRTDVSAGSCNVQSQSGNDANKQINVHVSAGTAKINFN